MERVVVSDKIVESFAAAGLSSPDVSVRSDEFLAAVKALPQRNWAHKLLRKLLDGGTRAWYYLAGR